MPPDENKRVLAAYVAEVLQGKRPEAAAAFLHPGFATRIAGPRAAGEGLDPAVLDYLCSHAPEAAERYMARKGAGAARARQPPSVELLAAVPDLRFEPLETIAEGENVVLRFRMGGHHTGGPLRGVPPSGQPFEVEGLVLYRFEDGKIRELWGVWEDTLPLRPVGARPQRGPDSSGFHVTTYVRDPCPGSCSASRMAST